MNKSYLIVLIPAVIVGAAYVALMVALRAEVFWTPFIGAGVLVIGALWLVRRNAKRDAAERAKKVAAAAQPAEGGAGKEAVQG